MSTPPVAVDPAAPALKPGHKTSEFALVALTELGLLGSALAGVLPPRYAAVSAAVGASAYALSRGLAKTGA